MTQPSLLSDRVMAPPEPIANPVAKERARLNAAALRVLARLKAGPATNWQLVEVGGIRAVGRVHELREDGWQITKAHDTGGTWTYTLHGYR